MSNLSKVSSSSIFKSQAMYSSAASVILGHHDKSSARSFCRFSAINSTPSSVILLQPERDNTVKCGNEWTARKKRKVDNDYFPGAKFCHQINKPNKFM